MAIFFNFSPTANHLRPLQVVNCDSNSRLGVDEDDNVKSDLKGLNALNSAFLLWSVCLKALKVFFACLAPHSILCSVKQEHGAEVKWWKLSKMMELLLVLYSRKSYDISWISDWSRWPSRPIRSPRYMSTCRRIRAHKSRRWHILGYVHTNDMIREIIKYDPSRHRI